MLFPPRFGFPIGFACGLANFISFCCHRQYALAAAQLLGLVGVAMNALVIFSNGGRMPVDQEVHPEVIKATDRRHQYIDERTKFAWLADRFPVLTGTASLGDIFLYVSLILILLTLWLT
jgi:hypothetical protein